MKCFNLLQKEYVVMGKKELYDILSDIREWAIGCEVYAEDLNEYIDHLKEAEETITCYSKDIQDKCDKYIRELL